MIPPAWMLPATVMVDEAQRDDSPLAIMRDNLAALWSMLDDMDTTEAVDLCRNREFLRAYRRDAIERYPVEGASFAELAIVALQLRARDLTPDVVEWEREDRDGVPGFWMHLPPRRQP